MEFSSNKIIKIIKKNIEITFFFIIVLIAISSTHIYNKKKVLLDYSAYNDNIDGRQEIEITTIPILYDNNNDNVTTSTSKYSKPALDDDFIKEFDTWLNSNEVRRKYQ